MTTTAVDSPRQAATPAAPIVPDPTPTGGWRSWLQRPLVACVVLFSIYAGLSLVLNDPRGTLGTDTGGKLATLHVMEQRGDLDPDIGYWAASADPRGTLHPLFYTYPINGQWVNVSTLPMLYAAYPLYLAGGDRGVLVIPMLAAVFGALAARALARRLGARTGWPAFWVIGLVSPLAIYALDFWEHALGLALMLSGVVLLLRMLDDEHATRDALLAGLCFGAAATMRTEALVYLVVCGGVACLTLLQRRRALAEPCARGVALLAGAAVPLLANEALERLTLGTTLRASRAAGTAAGGGQSGATRVHEVLTYLAGMNRFEFARDVVLGLAIAALVMAGTWLLMRSDERGPVLGVCALLGAVMLYFVGFGAGLGFVPGLLTASPFAAVGLLVGWRADVRMVTVMAVVALPMVWFFQYSGGAGPQWGARYTLVSGALLLVAATVVLEGHRTAFVGVVLVAALVTGFGIAWLSVRSTWVASGIEHIVDRHDQALISGGQHLLREGGAFYEPGRHWLTADTGAPLHRAVTILHDAGDTEFAYVVGGTTPLPRTLDGYVRRAVERVAFLRSDVELRVATYRLAG